MLQVNETHNKTQVEIQLKLFKKRKDFPCFSLAAKYDKLFLTHMKDVYRAYVDCTSHNFYRYGFIILLGQIVKFLSKFQKLQNLKILTYSIYIIYCIDM